MVFSKTARLAFYGVVGAKVALTIGLVVTSSAAGFRKATQYWEEDPEPRLRTAASVVLGHGLFTSMLLMNAPMIYTENKMGAKLSPEVHEKIGYGNETVQGWECFVTPEFLKMSRK